MFFTSKCAVAFSYISQKVTFYLQDILSVNYAFMTVVWIMKDGSDGKCNYNQT